MASSKLNQFISNNPISLLKRYLVILLYDISDFRGIKCSGLRNSHYACYFLLGDELLFLKVHNYSFMIPNYNSYLSIYLYRVRG